MNDRLPPGPITLSIAAVERDTGLSKDTLRVWERRYGFPTPDRDSLGERAYTLQQVEKLRLVKKLLDAGHRPGRIVPMALAELQTLSESTVDLVRRGAPVARRDLEVRRVMDLLQRHDRAALRAELTRQQLSLGLSRFVVEVVSPLTTAVGDAWLRGQLEIFEEHLFTETLQRVLHEGISSLPEADAGAAPCVVLSTFPGEPHGLGLLMAEAMLAQERCRCVSLGVQTPLWNIVLAAQAVRADVVALGFTGCLNPNQIVDALTELRAKLPPKVALWAGGSVPVLVRRRIDGVLPMPSIEDVAPELQRLREAMLPAAGEAAA